PCALHRIARASVEEDNVAVSNRNDSVEEVERVVQRDASASVGEERCCERARDRNHVAIAATVRWAPSHLQAAVERLVPSSELARNQPRRTSSDAAFPARV